MKEKNQLLHCTCIFMFVRKHLTRGFLCVVLDLSGTLWPLLIPEYSGIKRRGTPFLGLRNPGILFMSQMVKGDRLQLSLFDRDRLMFCKSGILIFVFAENNHLVRQIIYTHAMLIKTPLLHQSSGPRIFLSLSLSLYIWLIPWSVEAH